MPPLPSALAASNRPTQTIANVCGNITLSERDLANLVADAIHRRLNLRAQWS
ncbi:MAG: hypothetical protein K6U87_10615 [Firmicutes bacterium]|nr:hypothetical protein [Bacillota bacterium]